MTSRRGAPLPRFATEIGCSLTAVALLELAFYLYTDDSFSQLIYFESVAEVFLAPLHPGWRLIYPPALLGLLFASLHFIRKLHSPALRPALAFLVAAAWASLGFATIIAYY